MMETALYDDFSSPYNFHPSGMNNSMKRKLTLNLNFDGAGDMGGKGSVIKKAKVASLNTPVLLSTPDLAMCKLGTPDLERAIVQQYSSLPTPNIGPNQIFFSDNETAEAKEISAEFEQALNTVRNQHEKIGVNNHIVTTMADHQHHHNIIPTTVVSAVKIKKDPMLSDSIMIPSSMGIPTSAVVTTGMSLSPLMSQQATYIQIGQPVPVQQYYEDSDLSQDDTENSCSTSSSTYTLNGQMNSSHVLLLNNSMSNQQSFPVTSANLPHKLPDYASVTSAGGLLRLPVTSDNLYTSNSFTSIASSVPSSMDYPSMSQSPNPGGILIKEEPQTVPSGTSPPVSPINMESQEKIKLERKRQRNRVAASKCRQRKLERINKLETKVKQLKGENSELNNLMTKLKEHVYQLRQQLHSHVKSGCQIMMPSNMNGF